jgi:imidazolonepropionase-like amidohydrolase
LEAKKTPIEKTTVFTNVKSVMQRHPSSGIQTVFKAEGDESPLGVVVVEKGRITCSGDQDSCGLQALQKRGGDDVEFVDLEGGSVAPGLTSFGSPLGLEHINEEPSTNDGVIYDPLTEKVPEIIGGDTALIMASDGLEFESRDAL